MSLCPLGSIIRASLRAFDLDSVRFISAAGFYRRAARPCLLACYFVHIALAAGINMADLAGWVSNQLEALIGASDRTLAQFCVALASSAKTPGALLTQLAENDVPINDASKRFAIELFGRVPRKGTAAPRAPVQPTQAEILRQSQKYSLVLAEPEKRALSTAASLPVGPSKESIAAQQAQAAAAKASRNENSSSSSSSRREDKPDRHKHIRRRRRGDESSEEEEEDEDGGL